MENPEHPGEDDWADTHSNEGENTRLQSTQYRSSHSGYGSSSLQSYRSKLDEQLPNLNKSKEMQDAVNVTARMTIGSLPGSANPKQGLTNVPLVEEQQEQSITEDETANLDDLTITPKEDDAKNIQVR